MERKFWWKTFCNYLRSLVELYRRCTVKNCVNVDICLKYPQKNLLKKLSFWIIKHFESGKLRFLFKAFIWKITNTLSKCNIAFWYFLLFFYVSCISDIYSLFRGFVFLQGGIIQFPLIFYTTSKALESFFSHSELGFHSYSSELGLNIQIRIDVLYSFHKQLTILQLAMNCYTS